MTFPKHLGQVPITYSNRPSGRDLNNYADDDGQPRFPFGFGLSYTRFSYSGVNVDRTVIRPSESVRVSVDVRNDGERAGDEVVQLYLHHSLSDLAMPGKELRGFQRIHLAAGETRTVSFTLSERELATWDLQLKRTVRPGRVDLMIGRSSSDIVATCGIEIRD
jgi:beta-glucosidase